MGRLSDTLRLGWGNRSSALNRLATLVLLVLVDRAGAAPPATVPGAGQVFTVSEFVPKFWITSLSRELNDETIYSPPETLHLKGNPLPSATPGGTSSSELTMNE